MFERGLVNNLLRACKASLLGSALVSESAEAAEPVHLPVLNDRMNAIAPFDLKTIKAVTIVNETITFGEALLGSNVDIWLKKIEQAHPKLTSEEFKALWQDIVKIPVKDSQLLMRAVLGRVNFEPQYLAEVLEITRSMQGNNEALEEYQRKPEYAEDRKFFDALAAIRPRAIIDAVLDRGMTRFESAPLQYLAHSAVQQAGGVEAVIEVLHQQPAPLLLSINRPTTAGYLISMIVQPDFDREPRAALERFEKTLPEDVQGALYFNLLSYNGVVALSAENRQSLIDFVDQKLHTNTPLTEGQRSIATQLMARLGDRMLSVIENHPDHPTMPEMVALLDSNPERQLYTKHPELLRRYSGSFSYWKLREVAANLGADHAEMRSIILEQAPKFYLSKSDLLKAAIDRDPAKALELSIITCGSIPEDGTDFELKWGNEIVFRFAPDNFVERGAFVEYVHERAIAAFAFNNVVLDRSHPVEVMPLREEMALLNGPAQRILAERILNEVPGSAAAVLGCHAILGNSLEGERILIKAVQQSPHLVISNPRILRGSALKTNLFQIAKAEVRVQELRNESDEAVQIKRGGKNPALLTRVAGRLIESGVERDREIAVRLIEARFDQLAQSGVSLPIFGLIADRSPGFALNNAYKIEAGYRRDQFIEQTLEVYAKKYPGLLPIAVEKVAKTLPAEDRAKLLLAAYQKLADKPQSAELISKLAPDLKAEFQRIKLERQCVDQIVKTALTNPTQLTQQNIQRMIYERPTQVLQNLGQLNWPQDLIDSAALSFLARKPTLVEIADLYHKVPSDKALYLRERIEVATKRLDFLSEHISSRTEKNADNMLTYLKDSSYRAAEQITPCDVSGLMPLTAEAARDRRFAVARNIYAEEGDSFGVLSQNQIELHVDRIEESQRALAEQTVFKGRTVLLFANDEAWRESLAPERFAYPVSVELRQGSPDRFGTPGLEREILADEPVAYKKIVPHPSDLSAAAARRACLMQIEAAEPPFTFLTSLHGSPHTISSRGGHGGGALQRMQIVDGEITAEELASAFAARALRFKENYSTAQHLRDIVLFDECYSHDFAHRFFASYLEQCQKIGAPAESIGAIFVTAERGQYSYSSYMDPTGSSALGGVVRARGAEQSPIKMRHLFDTESPDTNPAVLIPYKLKGKVPYLMQLSSVDVITGYAKGVKG